MAELHVSKKSIRKFFNDMQNKRFIIPDYQRPYSWDIEKCQILWEDIENFSMTLQNSNDDSNYFLGTIVSYTRNKDLEIIDGQQRITSLMLLLRAFYKKLEDGNQEDENVKGLQRQLEPCIWDIDEISQLVPDKSQFHILSEVATEKDNYTFHNIIETGNASHEAQDNYSQNYLFFRDKCDDYAQKNPLQWKKFCVTILNRCIILPIECDTQDTALTIFSTLNDRGMPLEDSDIFKAQIYKNQKTEEDKRRFSESWKELSEICRNGNFSIDDIFRYYTHVIRGRNKDKSKEIGLRKFYAKDQYHLLKDEKLLLEIIELAEFWKTINTEHLSSFFPSDDKRYTISASARQYIHCLESYPNEYWKYPISVFFLQNKDTTDFNQKLISTLQHLTALLFAKAVINYGVSYIKDDIYQCCISLVEKGTIQHKFTFEQNTFENQLDKFSTSKMVKPFLLLYAYLHEENDNLFPKNVQVEHIFPKKWQDTNYHGWTWDDAKAYLEQFGNKTIIEKKLNIQAGNGYFGKKKEKYKNSQITTVKALANYPNNDWLKQDIEDRGKQFTQEIVAFIKKFIHAENNYS